MLRWSDLTLDFVRRTGLQAPLYFVENNNLGMKMVAPTFTVKDVM